MNVSESVNSTVLILGILLSLLSFILTIIKNWLISEQQYSKNVSFYRSNIIDRLNNQSYNMVSELIENRKSEEFSLGALGVEINHEAYLNKQYELFLKSIESIRKLFIIESNIPRIKRWYSFFIFSFIIGISFILLSLFDLGFDISRIVITICTTFFFFIVYGIFSIRNMQLQLDELIEEIQKNGMS